MTVLDERLLMLDGSERSLRDLLDGGVGLLVNVASRCGLTRQYAALQTLHEQVPDLTVVGFPCNQFGGQEPGTEDEIQQFCSVTYGTTFPMAAKALVNGRHADPLWVRLTAAPDAEGAAGEVLWNFEKFLVDRGGEVVARFRPLTDPTGPEVRAAVEEALRS